MDINDVKGTDIETYWHGKMDFTVGLCESMGAPDIFKRYLSSECCRPSDIPLRGFAPMGYRRCLEDSYLLILLILKCLEYLLK